MLEAASSQSGGEALRAAEDRLRQWETETGFYSALMVSPAPNGPQALYALMAAVVSLLGRGVGPRAPLHVRSVAGGAILQERRRQILEEDGAKVCKT